MSEQQPEAPAVPKVCPKCGTAGCLEDKAIDFSVAAEDEPVGSPPPVAAALSDAQCDRVLEVVAAYDAAASAVQRALELAGTLARTAGEVRVIAAAREGLRTLSGEEEATRSHESARELPRAATPEPASSKPGAADVAAPDRTTVLCPGCLHDGVLERTLERAEAAEAKLAEVIPGLRLLAEGCLDLASNGKHLDENTTASAAYGQVAADILAIISSEEERKQ